MKKKYIIPEIILVKLRCEKNMVSTSIVYNEEQTTSTQYVKEDIGSSSGYNVWDDDWSK